MFHGSSSLMTVSFHLNFVLPLGRFPSISISITLGFFLFHLFRIRNINDAFHRVQTLIVNALFVTASDILCCSGIFYGRGSRQHTLDGSTVRVDRRRRGAYIDDVLVAECDLVADGGVVHALNSLLPRSLSMYARSSRRRHHSRKRGHLFGHRWRPNSWAFDISKK